MGGVCSTDGKDEKYSIWLENLKERDHLEEVGVDGTIIVEWILRK
jgi:hypothetical protein